MATVEEHETETLSPKARKAIWGAFVGFFVDMFDIYLPIAVLGPATIYFVSPDLSTSAAAIVGGLIFASTLAGRPLGALLFGHYADRIGRRRITIIVVCGVGTATLLLALMPGYQQWGMVAVAIFILLRFVGGLFMGGEYTAANPLAMEYCPKQKRGLYSGIIQSHRLPHTLDALCGSSRRPELALRAVGMANTIRNWGCPRVRAGGLLLLLRG